MKKKSLGADTESMILEVAILDIRPGQSAEFEKVFLKAQEIIPSMPGYISHELNHCLEKANRYILLVRWETLEHHTKGFRGSAKYQEWKALLHHFYLPFPEVEHYVAVSEGGT